MIDDTNLDPLVAFGNNYLPNCYALRVYQAWSITILLDWH